MLEDGVSVCEFDITAIKLIDNVVKQAIMVPLISASKVVHNPVVHSKILKNDPTFNRFELLKSAFPRGKKEEDQIVKISFFIKPEQLPTGDEVSTFTSNLVNYFDNKNSHFIKMVDYCLENYTNEWRSVRLDFYVENLDLD